MQDWLTVIIVILIVGVLADGFRRMRAHRRETLRMSRHVADDIDDFGADDDALTSSDFPGGGPRVVGVRDSSDLAHVNQNLRQSYVASTMTRGAPKRQARASEQENPADVGNNAGRERELAHQVDEPDREPVLGSLDNLDDDYQTEAVSQEDDTEFADDIFQSNPYVPVGEDPASLNESPIDADDLAIANEVDTGSMAPQTPMTVSAPETEVELEGSLEEDEAAVEQADARAAPDEVLVINVMARRGSMFAGPELLDAMLAQGLRFGDMDIFHRHETNEGRGKILFSVANMVVPGTFALEDMDDFESPGISMFLSLPISSDSLSAYNLMAQSAQNIAQMLGGELKDENRSVMTRQTIEHGRQRVIEYERKRRLAKV